MTKNKIIGASGEDLAADFLISKGLKILERNVRTPLGEIDILAQDKNMLVIVEVKTIDNVNLESPLENITGRKLQKLINLAEYVALDRKCQNFRIDAVGVDLSKEPPSIQYVENITL